MNNPAVVAQQQGKIICTTGVDGVKRYFKNGVQIARDSAKLAIARQNLNVRCLRRTTPRKKRSSKKGKKRSSKKGKKRSSVKVAKTEVFVPHVVVQGKRPTGQIKTTIVIDPRGQQFPLSIKLININTVEGNIYVDILNRGKITIPFNKVNHTGFSNIITSINCSNSQKAIGFVFGPSAGTWVGHILYIYMTDAGYSRLRHSIEKIGRMAKRNKSPFVINKV